MKKSLIFLSICFALFIVLKDDKNDSSFKGDPIQVAKKWKAYEKVADSTDDFQSSSIDEEEKKILPENESIEKEETPNKRAPASKKRYPRKKGRKLIGKMADSTPLMNSPRQDWQELFVERLINAQSDSTKLFVKHTDSVLISNNSKARALEEVVVTFKKENHSIYSYKAWVDSETGAIVNTWANTQEHKFRKRPLTFKPTGQL